MKLESFLDEKHVKFEKHVHPTTFTSQGLATTERVSGYMVAKPVIVKGQKNFAMCVVAAPFHVDLKRVAGVLHERQVALASEKEMTGLFPDCELGAEPPIGSMFGMTTIMDRQLEEDDFIIMQAGTHTESVKLRREDWQRACKPIVASIAAN